MRWCAICNYMQNCTVKMLNNTTSSFQHPKPCLKFVLVQEQPRSFSMADKPLNIHLLIINLKPLTPKSVIYKMQRTMIRGLSTIIS